MTFSLLLSTRPAVLLALLLIIVSALPVYAQSEIVYSARYYYPPGDKRTSAFHLYRISPDGTGRAQITSGPYDDTRPVWSPDGERLLFERETTKGATRSSLCVVGANGGRVTTLIPDLSKVGVDKKVWLSDGRRVVLLRVNYERIADAGSVEIWDTVTRKRTARYEACDDFTLSPDRQTLVLDKTGSCGFVNVKTGKNTPVPMAFSPSLWADSDTLVSLESAPDGEEDSAFYGLKHVVLADRKGKETKRFTPQLAPTVSIGDDGPVAVLRVAPGSAASVGTVVLYSEHRLIYWFGILRLSDGMIIAERSGLSHPVWSPDGKRFATIPTAELTPYGKTGKKLFTTPLCIGTDIVQKPKAIVSGMVWVSGADWRGSRR